VQTASDVLAVLKDERHPVVCLYECCAATIRVAARIIDEIALEKPEIVRARIAGIAERLRESGVVLRAVDIPQSERSELLSCVGSN